MKLSKIGANQYEWRAPGGVTVLFSYSTPVAARIGNEYFKTTTYYSYTTDRHIKKWTVNQTVENRPQSFFDDLVERTCSECGDTNVNCISCVQCGTPLCGRRDPDDDSKYLCIDNHVCEGK